MEICRPDREFMPRHRVCLILIGAAALFLFIPRPVRAQQSPAISTDSDDAEDEKTTPMASLTITPSETGRARVNFHITAVAHPMRFPRRPSRLRPSFLVREFPDSWPIGESTSPGKTPNLAAVALSISAASRAIPSSKYVARPRSSKGFCKTGGRLQPTPGLCRRNSRS